MHLSGDRGGAVGDRKGNEVALRLGMPPPRLGRGGGLYQAHFPRRCFSSSGDSEPPLTAISKLVRAIS